MKLWNPSVSLAKLLVQVCDRFRLSNGLSFGPCMRLTFPWGKGPVGYLEHSPNLAMTLGFSLPFVYSPYPLLALHYASGIRIVDMLYYASWLDIGLV